MSEDIDPFERLYDACYRAYAERMAVATRITMSRQTEYAFARYWPRYASFDEEQIIGSRVKKLALPQAGLVDVTEDNTVPFGLVYVTFTNPHNRPADHNEVVKVAKL